MAMFLIIYSLQMKVLQRKEIIQIGVNNSKIKTNKYLFSFLYLLVQSAILMSSPHKEILMRENWVSMNFNPFAHNVNL